MQFAADYDLGAYQHARYLITKLGHVLASCSAAIITYDLCERLVTFELVGAVHWASYYRGSALRSNTSAAPYIHRESKKETLYSCPYLF